MFPQIEIFGRVIGTYAILAVMGILAAGTLAFFLSRRRGLVPEDAIILGLFSLIGTFLGGHLLYGITHIKQIIELFRRMETISATAFFRYLGTYFGGMVYYGGLFGGLLSAYLWGRHKKMRLSDYADAFAVALPLFHVFGRIGCFLAGCCYGVECDFGFSYTHSLLEAANGVSRFPVQLLEAFCNLLLFAALYLCFQKKKAQGKLMAVYLCAYAVMRFFIEFLRGDEVRGHLWILSTSQWISLVLLVVVPAVVWIQQKRRKRKLSPIE